MESCRQARQRYATQCNRELIRANRAARTCHDRFTQAVGMRAAYRASSASFSCALSAFVPARHRC